MKINYAIILGLTMLPIYGGFAANKKSTGIGQQRKGQTRVSDSLKRIKTQLDNIIDEYTRNELKGDDLNALKRFQSLLRNLTEKDIAKILEQLKKSNLLNESKTNDTALIAFDSQKNVITALNTIYLEWQQEQIFRELSERFRKLADTQRSNMRQAVKAAQTHNEIIPTNPSEEFKIEIRIQELDQNGINDESKSLIKTIEDLNKKLSRYIEPRPSLALKIVNTDLKPALQGSTKDIKDHNLANAALKERKSYIAMVNIARVLAPRRDDEEIIRQALRDVEEAIIEQQEILDDTNSLDESGNQSPEELAQDQADLVDNTDFIRQDIAQLVPNAAQQLSLSTDNQQEARAALNETTDSLTTTAETAATQQQAALENLSEAQAALEEALEQFAEGEGQGQGQGQGQGEGQGEGQGQGQGEGQGQPSQRGDGRIGNWNGAGGGGRLSNSNKGPGKLINLPQRERDALLQSSQAKTPQEYSTLVEQFLKRLSDKRR